MVPSYIQDLIPPLVSEVSDYPLRNDRYISVSYIRTSISQKSCIPSFIRLWNSLADDLKESSSLSTQLSADISMSPNVYDKLFDSIFETNFKSKFLKHVYVKTSTR